MGFLIQAVYSFIAHFPGLAARTHRTCGRMGRRLQIVMGFVGLAAMGGGALAGTAGAHGFIEGDFGYFPAILLGLVAAFLLAGGSSALLRAVRNPAPPAAPNVIPFRRPIEAARAEVHGPGTPGLHKARSYED